MLRSFPTCFPNFLTGVVLLVPCLLICLACATPFPIEALEEGMTTEAVRENFGEPEATNTVWDPTIFWRGTWTYAAESSWTYVHEERNWGTSVLLSLLLPHQIGFTVIGVVGTLGTGRLDFQWDWAYVERKPVVLHFEDERLVRWEVIEPYYEGGTWIGSSSWGSTDAAHHAQGHTHRVPLTYH